MKIAVYFGLPEGGALVHTRSVIRDLQKSHSVSVFTRPYIKLPRVLNDLYCLFVYPLACRALARDLSQYDLVYVTHDQYYQAPSILRYLTTSSLFYCHEPTRAFFEQELDIDPGWPLLNRWYERLLRFVKKRVEIKSASFATQIIANSRYTKRVISRVYGQGASVIYPDIDRKIFRARRVVKKRQVVIVGNDEPQKRLRLALDALALVQKSLRPTLVIVSPKTPVSRELLAYARSRAVVVQNLVGISLPRLVRLYQESKLTLATSLREPFGLSAVESIACGTPVVATHGGGFDETIRDGQTGYLVDASKQAIAQAVEKILLSPYRPDVFRKPFFHRSDLRLEDCISQLVSQPHPSKR